MDHREIEVCLPDFAAGNLDEATSANISLHIEKCAGCRSWLETYESLFAEMSRPEENEHPTSEILALRVTRPEEEYEFDGADLEHHLSACEDCRQDLERVGEAVRAARPSPIPAANTSPFKVARVWWRVAAAGIVGVGLGSLLMFGRLGVDKPEIELFEISDTVIEGTQLIQSEGSITISQVRIKDGATVTIHAGDSVAFGNGFQVGPETRVSIGAGPSDDLQQDHSS